VLGTTRSILHCRFHSGASELAKTLGIPQNRFEHPDGYIQLLKLLHASPWFQSTKPMIKEELEIWRRRAAFMDAIFYP